MKKAMIKRRREASRHERREGGRHQGMKMEKEAKQG